jgi:NTP pyrophosphatase (non-canonical NTP hydrolase)
MFKWGSRGREFKSLRPDFFRLARLPSFAFPEITAGMSDSIKELTAEICAFRDARDWAQFHNPKEMAVAIAAEAGELLQHFVWQDAEQSLERIATRRAEIESEMADVAILLFEMAANCEVDLAAAMRAKLARNEERYAVSKARGSNKKYNEL